MKKELENRLIVLEIALDDLYEIIDSSSKEESIRINATIEQINDEIEFLNSILKGE